jgi:hypothetical protein
MFDARRDQATRAGPVDHTPGIKSLLGLVRSPGPESKDGCGRHCLHVRGIVKRYWVLEGIRRSVEPKLAYRERYWTTRPLAPFRSASVLMHAPRARNNLRLEPSSIHTCSPKSGTRPPEKLESQLHDLRNRSADRCRQSVNRYADLLISTPNPAFILSISQTSNLQGTRFSTLIVHTRSAQRR